MSMEKKSLRLAYGQALVEAGNSHPDIVVLEADLGKSTIWAITANASVNATPSSSSKRNSKPRSSRSRFALPTC